MELHGDESAPGDAFAELVGMAVKVEPSLADRAARDLVASQRASASVAGVSCAPLDQKQNHLLLARQYSCTTS